MGNIDINSIRKKGFAEGSVEERIEEYCRRTASEHTDGLLQMYNELEGSRSGKYINSDLMKMVYPFYARKFENRTKYNMSITNSAAVLTNEAYRRAIQNPNVERCVFVVGPYGAGKSVFSQELLEQEENGLLKNSIIYEGSITPPAFGEKIQYAIDHGVSPSIIALNPTLKLSMQNIRERAKRIGRDVEKKEVVDKYSNMYRYLKDIVEQFENIAYVIYSKNANVDLELSAGSTNLEDLNHGSEQEISEQYDKIIKSLDGEEQCISN